ncbi:MAG: hypothetical protein OXC94_01210 [Chloroflexi bacterium]|nr:hypothetical protein [Chloroflexota bacterium]
MLIVRLVYWLLALRERWTMRRARRAEERRAREVMLKRARERREQDHAD